MKKSVLKLQIKDMEFNITALNQIIADLIDRVVEVSEENADLREALSRRRKLYDSMLELVNRDQPKSMQDMAKVIQDYASNNDYTPYTSDEAMEVLLQIIG